MSGIVLSIAVRQNLSSLQATADLLATTQSRLSSGKKVNTALDNPTNFFTAASLDARASDINNLLDGIGNGVQILQAANTGITSLNKLVDSAKSIANQALQTTAGYSTKSNVSTTISGATADDLRGTQTFANAIATSNVIYRRHRRWHHRGVLDRHARRRDRQHRVRSQRHGGGCGRRRQLGGGQRAHRGTAGVTAVGGTLISALTNGATSTASGPAAGDFDHRQRQDHHLHHRRCSRKDSEGNYTIGLDQTLEFAARHRSIPSTATPV